MRSAAATPDANTAASPPPATESPQTRIRLPAGFAASGSSGRATTA